MKGNFYNIKLLFNFHEEVCIILFFSYIYKGKTPEELSVKWTKSKYKRKNQESLLNIEARFFNVSSKWNAIHESLYAGNPKNLFSFFVCRDPVSKLKSVYKYLGHMFTMGHPEKSWNQSK